MIEDNVKRAAVKWGIGRFLYSLEIQKVSVKKYEKTGKLYPVDDNGKLLFDGDSLTKYLNSKLADSKRVNTITGINLRNESAEKRATRYDDNASASKKSYTKDTNWSPELINDIERGDKKGSEVLKDFIPEYNKQNNTEYSKISDFKTDEELKNLVELVRKTPPDELS